MDKDPTFPIFGGPPSEDQDASFSPFADLAKQVRSMSLANKDNPIKSQASSHEGNKKSPNLFQRQETYKEKRSAMFYSPRHQDSEKQRFGRLDEFEPENSNKDDMDASVSGMSMLLEDNTFLMERKAREEQRERERKQAKLDFQVKKQLEFRGGMLHDIIPKTAATNSVRVAQYSGGWGPFKFLLDSIVNVENVLSLLILFLTYYAKDTSQVEPYFAAGTLGVNIILQFVINALMDSRRFGIQRLINETEYQTLYVNRKTRKWVPASRGRLEVGQILKILKSEEFPADCLLLDVQGKAENEKSYISSGPFDAKGIIPKKPFKGTSNKLGSWWQKPDLVLCDAISGLLKFSYRYDGVLKGSFKLAENPQPMEFDMGNVILRGQTMSQQQHCLALVLNVGQQCMGSPFLGASDSSLDEGSASSKAVARKLERVNEIQRTLYKDRIAKGLLVVALLYSIVIALISYIKSNRSFGQRKFEFFIFGEEMATSASFGLEKAMANIAIVLSTLPLCLTSLVQIFLLVSSYYVEWDVNMSPAKLKIVNPSVSLTSGTVSHLFFSRSAFQGDKHYTVKLFHVGEQYYLNKLTEEQRKKLVEEANQNSYADDEEDEDLLEDSSTDDEEETNFFDYLPNELIATKEFRNDEAEDLLFQLPSEERMGIYEFFKSVVLCHSAVISSHKTCLLTGENKPVYFSEQQDDVTALEFAYSYNFKLVQHDKRKIVASMPHGLLRFEDLGSICIDWEQGQKITVTAVKQLGQEQGTLYVKGSVYSLRRFLNIRSSKDDDHLAALEKKYQEGGVFPMVYCSRELSMDDTNQLILTINEGTQNIHENQKLEQLLGSMATVYPTMLGTLGLEKPIHWRNRSCIDDLVLNGVTPWIVSADQEFNHLTSLNSLKIIENADMDRIIIDGANERDVTEQIQSGLRKLIEKFDRKPEEAKKNKTELFMHHLNLHKGEGLEEHQHVVFFSGAALREILDDETLQKSFISLSYFADIMVGSGISPEQKRSLVRVARNFTESNQFTAAVAANPCDQLMLEEADIGFSYVRRGMSVDLQALSDVTTQNFYAVPYFLFKHGSKAMMRKSKFISSVVYVKLITLLLQITHMNRLSFTGATGYVGLFYYSHMLVFLPLQLIVFAILYKDYAYNFLYRLFGHYYMNFTFHLVQRKQLFIDVALAFFQWVVFGLLFDLMAFNNLVSWKEGKMVSAEANQMFGTIQLQLLLFFYFRNTNVFLYYQYHILIVVSLLCFATSFDQTGIDGMLELINCPHLFLSLLLQLGMAFGINHIMLFFQNYLIRSSSELLSWYKYVEERLALEEYEDPQKFFTVKQCKPFGEMLRQNSLQRILRLVNTNMMNVPKSDEMEQVLEKINLVLDQQIQGSQDVDPMDIRGQINFWSLQLRDQNKQQFYLEELTNRETPKVLTVMKLQVLRFVVVASLGILGTVMNWQKSDWAYLIVMLLMEAATIFYIQKVGFFTDLVAATFGMFLSSNYLISASSTLGVRLTGPSHLFSVNSQIVFNYVPTLVAFGGIFSIINIYFTFAVVLNTGWFIDLLSSFIKVATVFIWLAEAYLAEIHKKTLFIQASRRIRDYTKLKKILNTLLPPTARDYLKKGKNSQVQPLEEEISIVQIDILHFDDYFEYYTGQEVIQVIDKIFDHFDQQCARFGLQKMYSSGKTYLACSGMRQAEKKLDTQIVNRHHSVRVTDFAMELTTFVKTFPIKPNKTLDLNIGVHTGPTHSYVLGEIKPLFTIIGPSVAMSSQICSSGLPNRVAVSRDTMKFLELYTNNYWFSKRQVEIFGQRDEIFLVQVLTQKMQKMRQRNNKGNRAKKLAKGEHLDASQSILNSDIVSNIDPHDTSDIQPEVPKNEAVGAFDAVENSSEGDNESEKSDQQGYDNVNIFGFHDDLIIDDRMILRNPQENQVYNLVERPDNLLSFDLKETETEFHYSVCKARRRSNLLFMGLTIFLFHFFILADVKLLRDQGERGHWVPFLIQMAVIPGEVYLFSRVKAPAADPSGKQIFAFAFYWLFILGMVLYFKYENIHDPVLGPVTEAQLDILISLTFMINTLLMHHLAKLLAIFALGVTILTYGTYFSDLDYKQARFPPNMLLHCTFMVCFAYYREMTDRKCVNYDRYLQVEVAKTNKLVSNYVPAHMVTALKSEKREVDEFEDVSLLLAEICGIRAAVSQGVDTVTMIQFIGKLLHRFELLAEEKKVYQISQKADQFFVMSYNGRVDKHKRGRVHAFDEVNRLLQLSFEMHEACKEMTSQQEHPGLKELSLKIGIHTGWVVAGLIGTKLMKYDVYGEGVLITSKVKEYSQAGGVYISEDTKALLESEDKELNQIYRMERVKQISVTQIGKLIDIYKIEVEVKLDASLSSGELSLDSDLLDSLDDQ